MPLDTDDRDEVSAGPEAALVGAGGRMGFGTDEADEVPARAVEAGEEAAGPDMLPVGEGGRIGLGDEAPIGSEVAVMSVVDEEVTVTGQTVVDTAMTMVLTGQSLIPGPQL